MNKTIYDCWRCVHRNDHNPYGIDYCDLYDTRCNFANDRCNYSDTESSSDGDVNIGTHHGPTFIGWYLITIILVVLSVILFSCATQRPLPALGHDPDTMYWPQQHIIE